MHQTMQSRWEWVWPPGQGGPLGEHASGYPRGEHAGSCVLIVATRDADARALAHFDE